MKRLKVKDCPWLLFEPNEKEGRKLLAGSSEIWSDAFAPAGRKITCEYGCTTVNNPYHVRWNEMGIDRTHLL